MAAPREHDGVHARPPSQRSLKQVYMAHGMKRSGNHAIIGWILSLEGRLLLRNNAIPIRDILLGIESLPAPVSFEAYLASSLPALKGSGQAGRRERIDLAIAKWPASLGLAGLTSRIFQRRLGLICSLEDHDLEVRVFDQAGLDLSNLLILRSPDNLFASRLRKGRVGDHPAYPRERGAFLDRAVETWKSHAREFLGRTTRLPDHIGVYFDLWFQSAPYRRDIASRLGLASSAEAHREVASFGGGSSFDGRTFDGAASTMKVLERRALLDGDERALLDEILDDPEIGDLKAALDLYVQEQEAALAGDRERLSVSSRQTARDLRKPIGKRP